MGDHELLIVWLNGMQKNLAVAVFVLFNAEAFATGQSKNEARVTRVIRQVELVEQNESTTKPAAVDDKVTEDTAVRTGEDSRSELTFKDLTITRLGENSIFTFNKAGRDVQLNAGSILLYVPKNSGGAHMATDAVSVAITGTTVILRAKHDGRSTLTVLEDGAQVSLIKNPKESVYVKEGEMVDVPRNAIKMPKPVKIDLEMAMNSPLITDFGPLPKPTATNKSSGGKSKKGGGSAGPAAGNQSSGGQSPSGGSGAVNRPPRSKKPVKPKPTPPKGNPPKGGPGNNNGVNPNNPQNGGKKPKKKKKPYVGAVQQGVSICSHGAARLWNEVVECAVSPWCEPHGKNASTQRGGYSVPKPGINFAS